MRPLIDAHLLASAADPASPSPLRILRPADAFHYHNLPNLVPFLRRYLVSQAWEEDLLGSLMSPFCLHINRSLRPHEPVPSTPATETTALNLLHGLLLGLYPYNVRQPGYDTRVRVVRWVRAAMCAPSRADCLRAHESLLGLAAVEYLANVVCDFCPVEEALLVRTQASRFTLNNMCDGFRSELITLVDEEQRKGHGDDGDAAFFSELEKRAAVVLAAVQRQLKLCNHRPCKRAAPRALTRRIPPALLGAILDAPVLGVGCGANSAAQIKLMCPGFEYADIQAMEFVWSNLAMHMLPASIHQRQSEALERHGSCEQLQGALITIHICVACAMSHKGCVLQHRCSYKCDMDTLHCTTCKGPMQSVRLLGRVLRVRQASYCLCPTCLRPVRWDQIPLPNTCARCTPPAEIAPRCCSVCDSRNIATVREVVDCERLEFVRVPLCHRHAKRCMTSRTSAVYDIRGLEEEMRNAAAGCGRQEPARRVTRG